MENDLSTISDMTKSWVLKMTSNTLERKNAKFKNRKRKLIWGKQILEYLVNVLVKLVEYMKLFVKGSNKKYHLIKDK